MHFAVKQFKDSLYTNMIKTTCLAPNRFHAAFLHLYRIFRILLYFPVLVENVGFLVYPKQMKSPTDVQVNC